MAKPLTAEGFSRYGDVIEISPENEQLSINYGRTVRHHALSEVQLSGSDDTAIMNIFSSQPAELPFKATVMERHPLGSQAFIPLSGHSYLVAVAPPGAFDISARRTISRKSRARRQLSSGHMASLQPRLS